MGWYEDKKDLVLGGNKGPSLFWYVLSMATIPFTFTFLFIAIPKDLPDFTLDIVYSIGSFVTVVLAFLVCLAIIPFAIVWAGSKIENISITYDD